MLKAVKGNVVYTITEDQAGRYQKDGYDIVEELAGSPDRVVQYGAGKTVPYDKYLAIEAELDKARAELKALRGLIETQAKKKRAPAKKPAKK